MSGERFRSIAVFIVGLGGLFGREAWGESSVKALASVASERRKG